MTLLLLLLSNYSKEPAIYNFVKNNLLKKTKNFLRNFEPTFSTNRSKVSNNNTTDSSSVEKKTTALSFLTDSTTNSHKKAIFTVPVGTNHCPEPDTSIPDISISDTSISDSTIPETSTPDTYTISNTTIIPDNAIPYSVTYVPPMWRAPDSRPK